MVVPRVPPRFLNSPPSLQRTQGHRWLGLEVQGETCAYDVMKEGCHSQRQQWCKGRFWQKKKDKKANVSLPFTKHGTLALCCGDGCGALVRAQVEKLANHLVP